MIVGDAVIVRRGPAAGSGFIVHASRDVQVACSTYAEAEARATSYAELARMSVWYVEAGRFQLVCSFAGARS